MLFFFFSSIHDGYYLASSVRGRRVQGFFPGHGVPVLLAVGLRVLLGVHNGRKRRGNHHTLHTRSMSLDGLENARGALNRGVQEVLDGVLHVVVEGGCRVQDVVERGVSLNSLSN